MMIMQVVLIYYFMFGGFWIGSGLACGWMRFSGDPLLAAMWVLVLVAFWPAVLAKLIWDVSHWIEWTDLGP